MPTDTKHAQQRRFCDSDNHHGATDAELDRWCVDYHIVRIPVVTHAAGHHTLSCLARGRCAPGEPC